jgi:hypothetical protein
MSQIIKTSVPPSLSVTWEKDDTTMDRIFEMRYNAMVRNNQSVPHISGHLDTRLFDELDFYPTTKHMTIIKNDAVIASCRFNWLYK